MEKVNQTAKSIMERADFIIDRGNASAHTLEYAKLELLQEIAEQLSILNASILAGVKVFDQY